MSRPARPRRIVVLTNTHAAHHPRHHYRLASALHSAGYDVTMMSGLEPTPGHEDKVPVVALNVPWRRLPRMLNAPVAVAQAMRRRPDMLYIAQLELLPWGVLTRLLSRRTVVVYDSNEEYDTYMLIKEWLPEPARPVLRRLVRWLEPALAKRLDAATTALPATQEKFTRAGVRSLHVRNFPPESISAGLRRDEPFRYDVLLGGSLPPDQIPILARTAALLQERNPGVRWLLIGRSYGPTETALLETALREAGVRESFELRFNVPFLEMREAMEQSRIAFLLYPSGLNYAARIPLRLFEYMAAGMPFVAGDLPTIAMFAAGRGVGRLVEAGDPAAYAEGLGGLLDDPDEQRAMSSIGPGLIAGEYNWDRESQKLVGLAEDLIGPP